VQLFTSTAAGIELS